MTISYQSPNNPQGRPRCWGISYDNDNRECRGCGYQNSCRSQIIEKANQQRTAPMAVQSFYQPGYQAPQPTYTSPYQRAPAPVPVQSAPVAQPVNPTIVTPQFLRPTTAAPTPVQVQPAPQVVPLQAAPAPSQVAQVQQVPQPGGFLAYDRYGWLQDPAYYHMAAMPVPPRVQMPGETFSQRVGKNMLLSAVEAVLGQAVLAVRQVVWAPPPPQAPPVAPPQMVPAGFDQKK